MRFRSFALLLCSALLAAACGSTASKKTGASSKDAGPASPAEAVAASDAPVAEEVSSGGTAAGGTSKRGSASTGTAATGTVPGAGGVTSSGLAKIPGSGPGYTENEIKIGLQIVVDTEAGFQAVGANASGAPDEAAIAQAMVDWVNANGGIAGRKVVPVFHKTEVLNGTWAAQAQAACATFTADNRVAAVITSSTGGSDAIWSCLSQKGVPVVERNMWLFDDRYYTERPDMLYQPSRMSPDRWIGHWLAGLKDIGFFKDAKVGLARFDGEPFERLMKSRFEPALQNLGLTLTDSVTLTTPPSVAAFGNMNAEIGNAIVRFRQRGVTHVIFFQNAGILPFFWMPQADSQRWYPEYGLSSADIPATLAGLAPESQLEKGRGVSWMPSLDTGRDRNDAAREAREKVCRDIKGMGVGFHQGTMCDAFLFLRYSLDRATELDAGGLGSVVRKLGSEYQSPMTVESHFDGSRFYDSASAVRYFDWVAPCQPGAEGGCYRMTSGPKPARR